MSQNSAQVRVVDPILSEHARGYRRPGNVGYSLFPRAPVTAYGGKVLTFGKEAFRLYNAKRAPGSTVKRINLGYAGEPYAITPSALEGQVPWEHLKDADAVPGINLGSRAVNVVLAAMELGHEYDCAQIARDATKYDNDHKVALLAGDRWKSDTSDPNKDVQLGMEAIGDSIGIEGNTVLLSRSAFNACKLNPKIIDRIKHTSRDSVTIELLKALWDVENIVVGGAKAATGPNDAFSNVWGDDVVVAYVAQGSGDGMGNMEEPSYGYSYLIEGMPSVEEPYNDRGTRSWVYPVASDQTPVLSGMTAGYLIQGAGAPPA
ncbi:hypothetical protein ACTJI2_13705 [Pseudoxanthomonas sp. 22568]|uniref:hypothetical protein n=1 Tax=Pseudoxanthomonas sp. 22568 TaxID=3453945 RepID=UPI003F8287B0